MLKSNKQNKLSNLVKQVNALNFHKIKDLKKVKCLLSTMYEEWSILKNKHALALYGDSVNKKLCAAYEAEEDLIVGLLFVLQEKSMEYFAKIHK